MTLKLKVSENDQNSFGQNSVGQKFYGQNLFFQKSLFNIPKSKKITDQKFLLSKVL